MRSYRRNARALALAALVAAALCGPRPGGGAVDDTGASGDASSPGAIDAPAVRRLDASWVEVDASVLASDDEAPARARERALAQARRAAIEFVAGVRVKSGLVSFEQVRGRDASSLVQVLSTTRADALVVDERVVESRSEDLSGGGYRLRIRMRARVLDRSASADTDFRTEVKLERSRFLHGEEVHLAVRASRDARIYVIGIAEDGAALILPNAHLRDTRVEGGRWLHFPDASQREAGVRLIAQVPEGRSEAGGSPGRRRAQRRPATRGDRPRRRRELPRRRGAGRGGLLADLLLPLADLPPDSWTFDQVAYEVLAR